MSYPTKYERLYDYVSYQNTNPNRPLPATRVHADLNAVALSTDEIVEFLKGFTRSDGALANESVGIDQLETSVAAMIGDTTAVDDLVEASEAAVAAAVAADASADSASTAASNAAASASASATSASAAATSESNAAATLADAVVGAASSVDGEVMLFDGITGKASKRASFSGLLKAASGVLAAATALTDYFVTSKGSDIASATGDLIDVTGTTTVTAITLSEGQMRTVRAAGIFKFTNGASLVMPGGSDIITAVGDFNTFRGYAAGVVRCVSYQIFHMNEEVAVTVTAASPFPAAATGSAGFVWNQVGIPRAGLWEAAGNTGVIKTGGTTPTYTHRRDLRHVRPQLCAASWAVTSFDTISFKLGELSAGQAMLLQRADKRDRERAGPHVTSCSGLRSRATWPGSIQTLRPTCSSGRSGIQMCRSTTPTCVG